MGTEKEKKIDRDKPEDLLSRTSKRLDVTFSVELFPKKEFSDEIRAATKHEDEGVFAVQELQVGQEDFVVVMGRTHTAYR